MSMTVSSLETITDSSNELRALRRKIAVLLDKIAHETNTKRESPIYKSMPKRMYEYCDAHNFPVVITTLRSVSNIRNFFFLKNYCDCTIDSFFTLRLVQGNTPRVTMIPRATLLCILALDVLIDSPICGADYTTSVANPPYFNLNDMKYSLCDDGFLPAVARIAHIDDIDAAMESMQSLMAPPSTTETKTPPKPRRLEEIFNEADHSTPKIDARPNAGSAEISSVEKFVTQNSFQRRSKENLETMLGVIFRGYLRLQQQKSKKGRLLQEGPDFTQLMNIFGRFLMHLASPAMTTLLSTLIGINTNNDVLAYPKTNSTIHHALCSGIRMANYTSIDGLENVCLIERLFFTMTYCGNEQPLNCTNPAVWQFHDPKTCFDQRTKSTVDMQTHMTEFKFADLREGIPRQIPETFPADLWKEEGFRYYVIKKALVRFLFHGMQTWPCGSPIEDSSLIPGWKFDHLIIYHPKTEKPDKQKKRQGTPFLFILRPDKTPASCEFILVFRASGLQSEWLLNLDIKSGPFIKPEIKFHNGFRSLSYMLFKRVLSYFRDKRIFETCKPAEIDLTLAGHSLGSPLAAGVSFLIAETFQDLQVNTIMFAAANSLNRAGVDLFRKKVNNRHIAVDFDPIAHLLCDDKICPGGLYACDFKDRPYDESLKVYNVPFPGVLNVDFQELYLEKKFDDNIVSLNTEELSVAFNPPATFQYSAAHSCAYQCKVSQYCVPENSLRSEYWTCSSCPDFLDPLSFDLSVAL